MTSNSTTATHTPGPWRHGNTPGSVVSGEPSHGMNGSDDVAYYGGYLIAESVAPHDVNLIAAAPDLLSALKFARSVIIENGVVELSERMAIEKMDAAIAKAEGVQ